MTYVYRKSCIKVWGGAYSLLVVLKGGLSREGLIREVGLFLTQDKNFMQRSFAFPLHYFN